MGELGEALGGLAVATLIVGLVLGILYLFFGSQVLGVPTVLAILVVFALRPLVGSLGPLVIVAIVVGLLVLFALIGMAMTFGTGKPPRAHDEKPGERQP